MRGERIRNTGGPTSVVFIQGILSSGESGWRNKNGTFWPEIMKRELKLEPVGLYVFTYETDFFSRDYRLVDVVDALKEHMRLDGLLTSEQISSFSTAWAALLQESSWSSGPLIL
jgi:hypothetical protein